MAGIQDQVKCYDNGGLTFDRYTLVTNNEVYCASFDPFAPNGVSCYVGYVHDCIIDTDTEISYDSLPATVKRFVRTHTDRRDIE